MGFGNLQSFAFGLRLIQQQKDVSVLKRSQSGSGTKLGQQMDPYKRRVYYGIFGKHVAQISFKNETKQSYNQMKVFISIEMTLKRMKTWRECGRFMTH